MRRLMCSPACSRTRRLAKAVSYMRAYRAKPDVRTERNERRAERRLTDPAFAERERAHVQKSKRRRAGLDLTHASDHEIGAYLGATQ